MAPEKVFRAQMHGILSVLRGFARYQTEDHAQKTLAVSDIARALEDFATIGVENELTWVAATVVQVKQGNQEEAIHSLEKLEGSDLFTKKEKVILAEAKAYLKNRDPDAALNIIVDRVVMYKLGAKYAYSYLREIEWTKLLEKTRVGKRILAVFAELEERYEHVKQYLNKETIWEKGKKLVESILHE